MKYLIAGLGKSGTTGLMYLIANSLPGKPRLLFEPRICPGDVGDARGDLVAKVLIAPGLRSESFAIFDRKVTIVRDPRDRMISQLLYSQFHAPYLDDNSKVGIVRELLGAKERDPQAVSIRSIVETFATAAGFNPRSALRKRIEHLVQSSRWFSNYVQTINDGFLIRYENFIRGELDELEAYLGLSLSGSATVPDSRRRVERTKSHEGWRDWLTEEDVRLLKPAIDDMLRQWAYDPADWELNDSPRIDSQHCSGYFERLVEERRNKAQATETTGRTFPRQVRRSTQGAVITVVVARPRQISGWAVGNDPSIPSRVTLSLNGAPIASTIAEQPRPRLRTQGMHPSGDCGFSFGFDAERALPPNAEIDVSTEDLTLRVRIGPAGHRNKDSGRRFKPTT